MFRRLAIVLAALVIAICAYGFDGGKTGRMFHMFGDPYPRVVQQAFAWIDRQYVEPARASPDKLLEGAFKGLETRFPPVIIDTDDGSGFALVRVGEDSKQVSLTSVESLSSAATALNEVLVFVAEKLEGAHEASDVYYAALNGAVAELDPHSNAINPKQFKEFMINTRGSFGGIGFVFGIRDGNMIIITPIEGTPADRGGLKSGDRIILIDGEPTINMPTDVAASKMRGDPATKVTLTIERDGWSEPRPLTFTREIIHVVSVQEYMLEGSDMPPVLMVKIKNFQKDTAAQLKSAITKAEAAYPDLAGVIVDMRNNPGGLLDQAITISDAFLESGTIVSTKGRGGQATERSEAVADKPYTDKPLIVLINQGSASASEIVAGALRPDRALLIGTKTFGKGSVQKLFRLPDEGALKLTVAQYLTANDISIQSIGIQPHILTYAAAVKEGRVRIGPPPSHTAEVDLENAFTDWGNASQKPWKEVQYFAPPTAAAATHGEGAEGGEGDEAAKTAPRKSFDELTTAEKIERLSEDFPVALARKVLANIPVAQRNTARRKELFVAAEKALVDVRKTEQEELGKSLSELGVDWSDGDTSLKGLVVTLTPNLRLEAGEKGQLEVTVRNNGDKPVFRVWGRSDSDNPFLKNIDFTFGRIDPGEERSWTAEIKAPKSSLSRWDPVKVELHAGDEVLTSAESGAIARASVKPAFSYAYTVNDVNDKTPALSGNGIIDLGDRVELALEVTNHGEGVSNATEVNIRGEGAQRILLEAARHRLEEFKAGETRKAPMSFSFEQAADDNSLTVVVNITDSDYAVGLSDTLKFGVGKSYVKSSRRQPPTLSITKMPPLRTPDERILLSVEVTDDEQVKELYVYLDGKKVYYSHNADGDRSLNAEFSVDLQEGSNFLSIAASDQNDVIARKSFFIYKADSGEELAIMSARPADASSN